MATSGRSASQNDNERGVTKTTEAKTTAKTTPISHGPFQAYHPQVILLSAAQNVMPPEKGSSLWRAAATLERARNTPARPSIAARNKAIPAVPLDRNASFISVLSASRAWLSIAGPLSRRAAPRKSRRSECSGQKTMRFEQSAYYSGQCGPCELIQRSARSIRAPALSGPSNATVMSMGGDTAPPAIATRSGCATFPRFRAYLDATALITS
jgi:hypothetical protein